MSAPAPQVGGAAVAGTKPPRGVKRKAPGGGGGAPRRRKLPPELEMLMGEANMNYMVGGATPRGAARVQWGDYF
jgi:hypothetical protein